MSESKLVLKASENNKEPILKVLQDVIPEKFGADATLKVLEIASGSGQHVVHFAKAFKKITWQPSDVEEKYIESIKAYIKEENLENVKAPLKIDISKVPYCTTQEFVVFLVPWYIYYKFININHVCYWYLLFWLISQHFWLQR